MKKRGIVNSVKRKVFGKDGEEICVDHTSGSLYMSSSGLVSTPGGNIDRGSKPPPAPRRGVSAHTHTEANLFEFSNTAGNNGQPGSTNNLQRVSSAPAESMTTAKDRSEATGRTRGDIDSTTPTGSSSGAATPAGSGGKSASSRRNRLKTLGANHMRSASKTDSIVVPGSQGEMLINSTLKVKEDEGGGATSKRIERGRDGTTTGSGNKDVDKRQRRNRKEISAAFCAKSLSVPFEHRLLKPGLLPQSCATADPTLFESLALLRDCTAAQDREVLLRRKINACADVVFDFGSSLWQKEKQSKTDTLNEILDFVINTKGSFKLENVIPDVLSMIRTNTFRDLPDEDDFHFLTHLHADEDEFGHDCQWVHRSLVYEFFVRFIFGNDIEVKVLRQYITQSFVLRLLDLFQSEDAAEREYLKSLLHRIYGRVMSLRQFIRRSIQNVFHRFLEGQGKPYGISELLEILGSIINGFATPLKPEHKVMLERSFIPLHKSWAFSLFENQLQFCMLQYVSKDRSLAEPIVNGILRYWPLANTQKELFFVGEIEEILTELRHSRTSFERIKIPLFTRLAQCIQSSHFQVAERVLFLWHPQCSISALVDEHRDEIFPILTASLYHNSVKHWNGVVHQLTYQVSKLMTETDEKLFSKCNSDAVNVIQCANTVQEHRESLWRKLEQAGE